MDNVKSRSLSAVREITNSVTPSRSLGRNKAGLIEALWQKALVGMTIKVEIARILEHPDTSSLPRSIRNSARAKKVARRIS